jgi:hypothetical protein
VVHFPRGPQCIIIGFEKSLSPAERARIP